MNLKYLLDTNVVSEPLRPKPAATILRRLRRHEGETAIASIVWHELQFGCARLPKSHRRTALERYLEEVVLASFPILDYGHAGVSELGVDCRPAAAQPAIRKNTLPIRLRVA